MSKPLTRGTGPLRKICSLLRNKLSEGDSCNASLIRPTLFSPSAEVL